MPRRVRRARRLHAASASKKSKLTGARRRHVPSRRRSTTCALARTVCRPPGPQPHADARWQ